MSDSENGNRHCAKPKYGLYDSAVVKVMHQQAYPFSHRIAHATQVVVLRDDYQNAPVVGNK